jgi:uncharacterized protein
MTLLWYAIQQKSYGSVQVLIRYGSKPDQQEVQGLGTPLHVALMAKDTYLVEHGAEVNMHLMNGSSTAWAVQKTIDRLQPNAGGKPVTDISPDKSGKLTETVTVPPGPGASPERQKLLQRFEQLRTLMIQKGVKFPPDSPAQVRAQMKKNTDRGSQ